MSRCSAQCVGSERNCSRRRAPGSDMCTQHGKMKAVRRSSRTAGRIQSYTEPSECDEFSELNWSRYGKVECKISTIENAGYGLFANVNIKTGDVLTGYEGKVQMFDPRTTQQGSHDMALPTLNGKQLVIRGAKRDKLVALEDGRIVNAGAIANDAYGSLFYTGKTNNSNNAATLTMPASCVPKTIPNTDIGLPNTNSGKKTPYRVFLVAEQDLKKGEEILWSYGKYYWDRLPKPEEAK